MAGAKASTAEYRSSRRPVPDVIDVWARCQRRGIRSTVRPERCWSTTSPCVPIAPPLASTMRFTAQLTEGGQEWQEAAGSAHDERSGAGPSRLWDEIDGDEVPVRPLEQPDPRFVLLQ